VSQAHQTEERSAPLRCACSLAVAVTLLVASGMALAACSHGGGRPSDAVEQKELTDRLGCDRVTHADYEPGMFLNLEARTAADCWQGGTFVARIHFARSSTAVDDIVRVLLHDRYGPGNYFCPTFPHGPSIVRGTSWVVVTHATGDATAVKRKIGGSLVTTAASDTPVVSYMLPC